MPETSAQFSAVQSWVLLRPGTGKEPQKCVREGGELSHLYCFLFSNVKLLSCVPLLSPLQTSSSEQSSVAVNDRFPKASIRAPLVLGREQCKY